MIPVYASFIFVLTTCIGSFLNVVIYRLPNKMSLAFPNSHCPKCNHPIKWYDNIPILSFIILKGKCRYCKEKISIRYLIVELLTGIISTLIFLKFRISYLSLFGILIFVILIPISFIDIEHHEIPDILQIILFIVCLISIFFNDLNYGNGLINITYKSKLIALAFSGLFGLIMLLIQYAFKIELIGGGDLKLLVSASILLGWQLLLLTIGISSILASIVEMINKIIKKDEIEKLKEKDSLSEIEEDKLKGLFPFGPYLGIGIMIAYTFGITILEWWFGLLL